MRFYVVILQPKPFTSMVNPVGRAAAARHGARGSGSRGLA